MSSAGSIVLGVDAGGTKTDAVVATLDGEVLGTGRAGCGNWELVGLAAAVAEISTAVELALAGAGCRPDDLAASAFGIAGVDWDSDVQRLSAALASVGCGEPRLIVNDSRVALRAGCHQPWGVVSSIGTGSVAAGVDEHGSWVRTMAVGWGEPSGATSLAKRPCTPSPPTITASDRRLH